MLKLDESHMNAIHVQMMNQQDLIIGVSTIMNFNLVDVYILKNMVST
jgi:hypothetical protein